MKNNERLVISILSDAFGDKCAGYLESYEPLPADDRGAGTLKITPLKEKARQFPDFKTAFEFWRQQSPTIPLRPDGKPNRPLTALTVTFERCEATENQERTLV